MRSWAAMSALLAICVASVLIAGCGRGDATHRKPETVTTIDGDKLKILGQQVYWPLGAGPPSYVVEIPVSEDIDSDTLRKLENRAFVDFAGPRGTLMGFRSVAISPVSAEADPGIDLGIVKIGARATTGPDNVYYREGIDGVWSRNGFHPAAPRHLNAYQLPSGVKYAFVDFVERFPKATLIYECLSCSGTTAVDTATGNFYSLINSVIVPYANERRYGEVDVVLFMGQRKSLWDFPPSWLFHLSKHPDGRWWGPIGTASKLKAAIEKSMAEFRKEGMRMRGGGNR